MALCWSAPSQRPSLRELRIMLLHLRAHSGAPPDDGDDFERKWNKMLPRRLDASPPHLAPAVGGGERWLQRGAEGGDGDEGGVGFYPGVASTPDDRRSARGQGGEQVHLLFFWTCGTFFVVAPDCDMFLFITH